MNRKKTIKQLMAIGVQRNDAAAFAKAYRKIMDAKREDLFPEIIKPVMPVFGNVVNYRIQTMRAVYVAPENQRFFFREDTEEFAKRIKGKLCEELAKGLAESGCAVLLIQDICGVGTKYELTVKVAMQEV